MSSFRRVLAAITVASTVIAGAAQAQDADVQVLFGNGSPILPADGQSSLDGAIASWKMVQRQMVVEVVGHADKGEPDPAVLSQQRAEAVRDYLTANAPPLQLTLRVRAVGASQANPETPAQNRSVEVFVRN